ncbi:type VI secretion system ImpA family N-terminal domain-containing protein [Scandinavium goeteborgense]|uniref:VasL domain-containing protein n=1 Tax=Scandinavium goeteborgense TaxID=1851514 RepID=UPI0021651429|nr:VasL domain-containing protein [Scandinavium goeteborgense]MCS2151058.1 type VI secretion system ImpA family N-terminal domain-containing protein [Scandinavium goeteborgense]
MPDLSAHQVKTGGDPRALPDFIALNNEMSKLMHPARPDIDWMRAEVLALSLFERNGVELQTVAWYTLARAHLARVSGMNEGLGILSALLGHQWAQCWPLQTHARAEILNGLMQRLQKLFRTFSLGPGDVPALDMAEKRLQEIKDILRRQELNHASQMNPLVQLIRRALSHLENNPQPDADALDATLTDQTLSLTEEVATQTSPLVYVINAKPKIQVTEDIPPPSKRWPSFIAGMATALILGIVAFFSWQALHHPDEAIQAMAASVARIPEPMTLLQIDAFREKENSQSHSRQWIALMTNQVNWIETQAPGWRLRYAQGLVSQAKALWPDDPATRALVQQWERYQADRTLPSSELNGWHDGMMQLRALSAQLDALDRHKGKYLTGSELKTIVWRITRTFAGAVPVEEQFRRLVPDAGGTDAPKADTEEVARHLDSLIHVLEQLSAFQVDVLAEKPEISTLDMSHTK